MSGDEAHIYSTPEERARGHYGPIVDPFAGGVLERSWVMDALARAREERSSAVAAIVIARQSPDSETRTLWFAIARDHRRQAVHLERYALRFMQSRIPRHLNFDLVRQAEESARSTLEHIAWTVVDQQPDDREPPPGLPPANGPPPRQLSEVHAPLCGVPAPPTFGVGRACYPRLGALNDDCARSSPHTRPSRRTARF